MCLVSFGDSETISMKMLNSENLREYLNQTNKHKSSWMGILGNLKVKKEEFKAGFWSKSVCPPVVDV